MNLTPQIINDVEFRQRVRGYDPDEVDDFLEKVADGVRQLLDRVREAHERAQTAERRAVDLDKRTREAPLEAGAADEPDMLRRTLVLAQRTADAAVAEAKDASQQIVAEAQASAARLIEEAQQQGRQLVVDAEAEARKSADDTRQRLVHEIITLEETRDAIRSDVSLLERHLDDQRLHLRSSITELQRLLDDPARMRMAAVPTLSEAGLPESDDARRALDGPQPELNGDEAVEIVLDDVVAKPGAAKPGAAKSAAAKARSAKPHPAGEAPAGFEDSIDEEAWARFTGEVPVIDPDGGPPTSPVTRFERADDLRERFAPVGPDEPDDLFEPDDRGLRSRFGRRR